MDKLEETLRTLIFEALGEESAIFMSQEIKGTEIVMPSEELSRIGEKLGDDILRLFKPDNYR